MKPLLPFSDFRQAGFLILAGILFTESAISQDRPAVASVSKPNILFIFVDDQSPLTMSAYGNEVCQTPNLDRLAREGMVLDNAHHMGSWVGAVCLPSRTMVQTSINVWRTQEIAKRYPRMNPKTYVHQPRTLLAELTPNDPDYESMPALFFRAGYDTYRTCKIGNTYEGANRLYLGRNDQTNYGPEDETGSWWHGEQVMNYLKEREKGIKEDPFLLFFGFTHPHDPRYGKPDLLDKYGADNTDIPTSPNPQAPPLQENYLPAHPFHHGHPGLRDEVAIQGVLLKRDEATVRNELGREYACIENIDRQVGRVLDKLEAMGELENTYIFYSADHGIAVGRHGLMGKQNLYEHTWRVPMIIRGPGIKAGSRAHGNTYLMDLLPTFCDLASIEKPITFDGISFKPVLMGERSTVRDVLYGVYNGGSKPGMRSVKKGDWKLIKYDVLDGYIQETQLFNLKDNPNEFLIQHQDRAVVAMTGVKPKRHQVNLAENPTYATKRKEMEALLLSEMIKWGDPYRLWDQPQGAQNRQ